jgi:delta8-fatty-acid desaturase
MYYVIMALARCNLYVQSYIFLLRDEAYSKSRVSTFRKAELAGLVTFATWFSYLVSYLPSWKMRAAFCLISHCLAGMLHVQITLSHFAMHVYSDSHPLEEDSFVEHQLKTSMDIECKPWFDWFHGGLQFQVAHHLFPRVPRCNLRELQRVTRIFCAKNGLNYVSLDFFSANKLMINHMRSVSEECRQILVADFANLKG